MNSKPFSQKPPYFTDKKVLITGASSGVGMALAFWYYSDRTQYNC